jgi:hypothetical protein
MKKDVNLGSRHWRGCHSFTDIICDGESVEAADGARNGALKMGGRYWYYYQIDHDFEFHNPAQPSTRACPFLPGQEVNVLEVPIQVDEGTDVLRRRSCSTDSQSQFTLNPEDKYRVPIPSGPWTERPKSRHVQSTNNQTSQSADARVSPDIRPVSNTSRTTPDPTSTAACESVQPPRAKSGTPSVRSRTTVKKLRRWRSFISRTPSRRAMEDDSLSIPVPPLPRRSTAYDESSSRKGRPETVAASSISSPVPPMPRRNTACDGSAAREGSPRADAIGQDANNPETDSGSTCIDVYSIPAPMREPPPPPPQFIIRHAALDVGSFDDGATPATIGERESWSVASEEHRGADECSGVDLTDVTNDRNTPKHRAVTPRESSTTTTSEEDAGHLASHSSEGQKGDLHYSNSVASSRTSGAFSSVVDSATAYTGTRSSWRLSQPLTPTTSGFAGLSLSFDHADADRLVSQDHGNGGQPFHHGGFHGYSLPEADHASALTITNLETATSVSSPSEERVPFESKHRQQIIDAWNDGAEHHQSSMQELVDDLGYLGELII